MSKFVPYALGAAAVVVALAVGIQFLRPAAPSGPAAVPSVQPTAMPSVPDGHPVAHGKPGGRSDASAHSGRWGNAAGHLRHHPLPAPDDALALTFAVPAGWHGFGDTDHLPGQLIGSRPPVHRRHNPQQRLVPVGWPGGRSQRRDDGGRSGRGARGAEGVRGLRSGRRLDRGYSGKRVDVVYPAELFKEKGSGEAPTCDGGVTRLFSDGGIYGQGPDERWQTNILDVDGTRFVIIVQDFPDTSAADRAGTDAIVDSMVIEP